MQNAAITLRSLGSARDDDTRVRFPHVSFHPAAEVNLRPFGAPPSNGRRENAAHRCLPSVGRAATGEYPFFPPIVISSECEKSFSFAVRQNGRTTENGKHRVP